MGGLVFDVARSALLIHDVVNDFLETGEPAFDAAFANVRRLAGAARRAGLTVVFAGPGDGGAGVPPRARPGPKLHWGSPGVDPPVELGPAPGDVMIRKPRYGAFHGSGLARWMRDNGRDTLIVCGLSLAGGVETSIRDAHNHDLASILVADACLCRAVPDQGYGAVSRAEVEKVVLSVLAQRFARVTTTDAIVAALNV